MAGPARGLPNSWMTAALEAPLRRRFPWVRVENDGVGALEAERRWGALQGVADCAYVTWSTGVGVGLCVDGRVLRGKNGNAGHAGHSFVADDDNLDALCGCGNVGDVEGLAAGNAIARRFGQDAAQLFAAAVAGEPRALATVDALVRVMGRMLYNLIATLDLQRISLGGSVFWHHRDFLLPRLSAQIDGRLPPADARCDAGCPPGWATGSATTRRWPCSTDASRRPAGPAPPRRGHRAFPSDGSPVCRSRSAADRHAPGRPCRRTPACRPSSRRGCRSPRPVVGMEGRETLQACKPFRAADLAVVLEAEEELGEVPAERIVALAEQLACLRVDVLQHGRVDACLGLHARGPVGRPVHGSAHEARTRLDERRALGRPFQLGVRGAVLDAQGVQDAEGVADQGARRRFREDP